jgi:cation transport ATPase
MRKLPGREKAISMVELKSSYLRQMEAFREARANKHRERNLHIHVKNMHTHTRETELKEEEEERKQCEAIKKQEEELRISEEQLKKSKKTCYIILLHTVCSTLCAVILINMCCMLINIYFIPIYFMYHILIFYAIIFLNSLSTN